MYNGPSYWQNRYDIKLAEQFQRFASGSLPNLEMRTAQVALLFLGYAPGKIDGVIGPRTRAAMRGFQPAKSSTDRLIKPCVKKPRSALRNDRGRQSFRPLLIPL